MKMLVITRDPLKFAFFRRIFDRTDNMVVSPGYPLSGLRFEKIITAEMCTPYEIEWFETAALTRLAPGGVVKAISDEDCNG